ncbi:MAG: hypothetical protein AB7K09_10690 [Planctomycetota bacterium]
MAHDVMVLLKSGPMTPRALADHLHHGMSADKSLEVTVQRDGNSGADVVVAKWPDYMMLFLFESSEDIMPECREISHLFASHRPDRHEIGLCSNRIRVLGADDNDGTHKQRAHVVHRVLMGLKDGVVFNPAEPGLME